MILEAAHSWDLVIVSSNTIAYFILLPHLNSHSPTDLLNI